MKIGRKPRKRKKRKRIPEVDDDAEFRVDLYSTPFPSLRIRPEPDGRLTDVETVVDLEPDIRRRERRTNRSEPKSEG